MSAPTQNPQAEPGLGVHDLPVLEVYRGIAALMVVVTHVGFTTAAGIYGPWAGWLARLDFGVALFFLLSGFLLFRPFLLAAYGRRDPVAVGAYLRRRFVRIYPALLVAILANYLLLAKARESSAPIWVATTFQVQNYFYDFGEQLDGLVQLWSLGVEVSFYAALPVLAYLIVGLPGFDWRHPLRGSRPAARRVVATPAAAAPAVRRVDPAPLVETGPIKRPLDAPRPMSRRELREQEAREKSLGHRLRRAVPSAPPARARVDLRVPATDPTPGPTTGRTPSGGVAVSVLPAGADAPTGPSDRRVGLSLLAMIMIAIVWRAAFIHEPSFSAKQLLWLPAFFDWFAVGMGLAWLRERPHVVPAWLRSLAAQPGVCWAIAFCGYWLMTTSLAGPYNLEAATRGENLTKHICFMLIGALLLLPAVLGDESQRWRAVAGNRFFTWLGRISFGVFLFHPMLMEVIRDLLRMKVFAGGFWVTLVLTLAASAAVGTLSWKYVEAPLQRRFRHGFGLRNLDRATLGSALEATVGSVQRMPRPSLSTLRRGGRDGQDADWGTDDQWTDEDLADTSAMDLVIDLRDPAPRSEALPAEADPPRSPSVGVPVYADRPRGADAP